MAFEAPLADMAFTLRHIAGFDEERFGDVPLEAILTKFAEVYPNMPIFGDQAAGGKRLEGDFEGEIAAETAAKDL